MNAHKDPNNSGGVFPFLSEKPGCRHIDKFVLFPSNFCQLRMRKIFTFLFYHTSCRQVKKNIVCCAVLLARTQTFYKKLTAFIGAVSLSAKPKGKFFIQKPHRRPLLPRRCFRNFWHPAVVLCFCAQETAPARWTKTKVFLRAFPHRTKQKRHM